MHGIYRKIRRLGADMECNNLSDVLLTMLDAQEILNAREDMHDVGPQMGEHTDAGRLYQYGKKTKAKQRRSPDSIATDQRIKFDEYDATTSDL